MNRPGSVTNASGTISSVMSYLRQVPVDDKVALNDDSGRPCTRSMLIETLVLCGQGFSACLPTDGTERAKIMTVLPDGAPTAALLLSLLDHASVVPANPTLTVSELRDLADMSGATGLLIVDGEGKGEIAAAGLDLPVIRALRPSGNHCADVVIASGSEQVGACSDEFEPRLILTTSGSTGRPKAVPLPRSFLLLSSDNIAKTLKLGETDVAAHILPMFHIGAIVDLLLVPLSAGGSVYFSPREPLNAMLGSLSKSGATWLQTVPTMLRSLLSQADDSNLQEIRTNLRFVRSVSADLPVSLHFEAEERLGVPILQMYGMTETTGQIASMELPPADRRAGSVGRVIGPEVKILDALGNPVETGTQGEVCISGPTVMKGYLGGSPRTAFFGRWLRSGDLGYLDDDGTLFLTGRLKEQINRGGEKISPWEIETSLMACQGVAEAIAFPVPHPSLGEEPAAAVVPIPGSQIDASALHDTLSEMLAPHKMPRRIDFVAGFPKLGSGKVDRVAIARQAIQNAESSAVEALPDEPGIRKIADIWTAILGEPLRSPKTDFFDAGGDSLLATSLILKVERALGRELPPGILYENPTFLRFAESVLAAPRTKTSNDSMLRALRRATAGWDGVRSGVHGIILGSGTVSNKAPFFFCGQGTEDYRDLVKALASSRPVYIMRSLSKLNRYPAFSGHPNVPVGRLKSDRNTERLSQIYAQEIDSIQPKGPIHVGGFCQGAVVARVIAKKLRLMGREVALLVIADRVFRDPTDIPALVFWSDGNRNSGSSYFLDAKRQQDIMFPKGAIIETIPTSHSGMLQGPWAEHIARSIDTHMVTPPAPRGDPELPERHRARLRLKAKRFVRPGEVFPLTVEVTNEGNEPWPPTEESGLHLGYQWRNLDAHIRSIQAGWAPLNRVVLPGERLVITSEVTCPQTTTPMRLLVDMVEDGAFWFHWRTGRRYTRLVLPLLPKPNSGE